MTRTGLRAGRRTARIALALAVALSIARPARAERLEAGPSGGHVFVNVFKAGLFSGFAHDHHFRVKDWSATAELPDGDPARATVHVVLFAASLHDEEDGLSDGDRRKVDERAAGPEVLDAARHPRIELRSERIDLARGAADAPKLRGTLHGTLTVRGRSVPISLPFELARAGPGWTVKGTTRVEQSKLGITPFSGFGGTVKVKDELEVELSVRLVPASG